MIVLFTEAWNRCSSVIVNCSDSDITSISCDKVLNRPIIDVENLLRTRVGIKHDSQRGSFCRKMLQATSIKS